MNIVAVLIVRVTHTGVYADGRPNTGSVTLYDLDESTISKVRERAVPIPYLSTVDIPMSTRTFVSFHEGSICKFTKQGLVTSEIILQFRDKSSCGGPAGTGQTLLPAIFNAQRINNVLQLVIPNNVLPTNLDSLGFLVGEPVTITGLVGNFSSLNGELTIQAVAPGEDLVGANTSAYRLEFPSEGPDIPQTIHPAGVNLCLSEGRVVTQFSSIGNVGGLGSNVFAYIGGQLLPEAAGAGAISVEDEGIVVEPATTTLNFTGAGVIASSGGPGLVDVTIPGGSGFVTYTAGANVQTGELLTIDSSGQVIPASSSIVGNNWRVVGVSQGNVGIGNPVQVLTDMGAVTNILFGAAPPGASNGDDVFLSTISGEATLTPPPAGNAFFRVGTLQGADGVTTTPLVVFQPQLFALRV